VDVPGFDRATMDGYAVVATSTEGAGAYSRLPLTVIGDSMPGRPFDGAVSAGQAVRVMTGAPVPRGADAVLPAEFVDAEPHGRTIAALEAVSPGKNVGRVGEDIARGTRLLERGRLLRPQDLGVISSVGLANVEVVRKPRVRLAVTGNELLAAGTPPHGFHIADANGPMLTALAERDGGTVDFRGLVRDDAAAITDALLADADVVIVSGGSSVGVAEAAADAAGVARRRGCRGRPAAGSLSSGPNQGEAGSADDHGLLSSRGVSPGCGASPVIPPLDYGGPW